MPVTLLILKPILVVLKVDSRTAIKRKSTSGERTFRGIADCGIASSNSSARHEMRIGLFTTRVECEARAGAVCVLPAPAAAAAPPTPLARAHSSTPRDSPPRPAPPRGPPQPSWDHMFLCNGFCCSPPLSCFLLK